MTAPFDPRHAAIRDPFSAYISDGPTFDMVRQVASEMGWPHERIHEGGLRSAAQGLAIAASPAILMVDLSDAADPLNDIEALAEVCEPGTIVVACGPINDIGFYRALVQSGIHDYLAKPFAIDELRDALGGAQAALLGLNPVDALDERPHLSVAVIGVRGGVGASTVAASLAWGLGQDYDRTTALLDLDVHFGTGALLLDLEPGRGLTDAIENPGRIDGLFLERAMVRANPKLSVLSAEAPIHQPIANDGIAFLQLQEELRQAFQTTVIDLPRHMAMQHPSLLQDLGVVILVTEFTLAATRDTIRILAWLRATAPRLTIRVIANRAPAAGQGEISPKEFAASIEHAVDHVLPYDAKLSVQAAKLGKPLMEVARNSKLGAALGAIPRDVLAAAGAEDEQTGSRSLLGRLANFRALLPKKSR